MRGAGAAPVVRGNRICDGAGKGVDVYDGGGGRAIWCRESAGLG